MEKITFTTALQNVGRLRIKASQAYLEQSNAPETAAEIMLYIAALTKEINSAELMNSQKTLHENLLVVYNSILSLTIRKPLILGYG